jgi:hypothetical protein
VPYAIAFLLRREQGTVYDMLSAPGFIIVQRWVSWFTEQDPGWAPPPGTPAVTGDRYSIESRYGGFDGLAWPESLPERPFELTDGVLPLAQRPELASYYAAIEDRTRYRVLYLSEDPLLSGQLPAFEFAGWDFGFYESEWAGFSTIYQEVILGKYREMRDLATLLNQNLLLSSTDACIELARVRANLHAGGADIEDNALAPFGPIAVYHPG